METKELISMINRDLADEHAAVLRYLTHAYLEGEDTVIGANLLARSREEMWHLHWLGMIVTRLGGEPELSPGPYPFDPTSQATMLASYIRYEEQLIPHYQAEAARVDDPHIKRVLEREAWESAVHARRFARLLAKLSPEEAARPYGGAPQDEAGSFIGMLQKEVAAKYQEMWQHIQLSWKLEQDGALGWALMDQAMEKMKQLSLYTEAVAEEGINPDYGLPVGVALGDPLKALNKAKTDTKAAAGRHRQLLADAEFARHAGLVMKLELGVKQEEYQVEEMQDWLKRRK